MNAVLNFPEIEDSQAAPSAGTAVAPVAAQAVDMKTVDLTDVALAQYGDWRKEVAATRANLSTLAIDLTTPTKIKEARSLRQRLIGDPLAAVRKVSAGIKSKMAEASKAVGAELERIEAAYAEADALILPQIEAREQALAEEQARRKREEEARKEKHRSGIANIRCYLDRCHAPGMTAERIARGIAALAEQTFGPEWEDFAVPAANAQCETLEAMRKLHAQTLGREQEAARQEAIRAENARVAEQQRIERARLDAEAAEIRRQAAELAAQQEAARRAAEPVSPPVAAESPAQAAPVKPASEPTSEPAAPTTATEAPLYAPLRRRITIELDNTPPAPIPPAPEPATITLGQIKEWAGMPNGLTREFVQGLGITPTVEGARLLFTATQRRELKAALLRHVDGLQT